MANGTSKTALRASAFLLLALTACAGGLSVEDQELLDSARAALATTTSVAVTEPPESTTSAVIPVTTEVTMTSVTCENGDRMTYEVTAYSSPSAAHADLCALSTTTTRAVVEFAPRPHDFTISLIVLEDKCFGSAGGLVTVQPELDVRFNVSTTKSYTIIYKITGSEDGSETRNMRLSNGGYLPTRFTVPTKRCQAGSTITAEVVRVLDR